MGSITSIIKSKKPVIMGVLNATPDSFSDGGKFNSPQKALERALEMEQEGADIIDIGGESTGPWSKDVTQEQELERVVPIIKAVRANTKIHISIDTYKAEVARIALEQGADMINDVTALCKDEKMAPLIAEKKCHVVLMYSKDETPRTAIKETEYKDVINAIKNFWQERIFYASENGINLNQIILDPGMGHFVSSKPRYSFEIIARLGELANQGFPVLIGASRKSFLGGKMETRDERGLIISALAYLNGARIIRTHDVKNTHEFLCRL